MKTGVVAKIDGTQAQGCGQRLAVIDDLIIVSRPPLVVGHAQTVDHHQHFACDLGRRRWRLPIQSFAPVAQCHGDRKWALGSNQMVTHHPIECREDCFAVGCFGVGFIIRFEQRLQRAQDRIHALADQTGDTTDRSVDQTGDATGPARLPTAGNTQGRPHRLMDALDDAGHAFGGLRRQLRYPTDIGSTQEIRGFCVTHDQRVAAGQGYDGSMLKRTCVLVVVVFGMCVPALAQDIEWHVTTDRLAYFMGEPVTFSMEACNTGSATVTVDMNVAPVVIDAEGDGVFGFTLVPWSDWVDIPPGECRSATDQTWIQQDNLGPVPIDQVPPGWYRGELDGVFSEAFEIQAPLVPISSSAAVLLVLALIAVGTVFLRR